MRYPFNVPIITVPYNNWDKVWKYPGMTTYILRTNLPRAIVAPVLGER